MRVNFPPDLHPLHFVRLLLSMSFSRKARGSEAFLKVAD
jgi:hypothetical protein